MKGITYLPVSVTFSKPKWHDGMFWHKDNPYFYYPYVFVSPFVTGMDTTREKDFPDAKHITADSGGYQIAMRRKGIKVSALDVLRWQENIADVAFTVDIPPYSYESEVEGYHYYTNDYFERCMIESNKNAWKMLEAQENPKMELWGVIQGGNYQDLEKWYNNLTKEHEFKGYTFPVDSTFVTRARDDFFGQLQFAKDLDTNFHFLGRCEPLLVMILAKLSQVTKRYYTYDTATAAMGLMLGKYHDPYFLSSLSFGKNKPDDLVKFEMDGPPPCDCPVCSKHTVKEMIEGYYTLFLHNVYVRKRFNDYVSVMVQDDDVFHELLSKYMRLQSRYKKQKDLLMEKIDNLIYGSERKTGGISGYF